MLDKVGFAGLCNIFLAVKEPCCDLYTAAFFNQPLQHRR